MYERAEHDEKSEPPKKQSAPTLPLVRPNMLGMMTSSLKRVQILDKWCPHEIALFESAICVYGKQFHSIAAKVRILR
jgi:hypothetical protein